MRVYTHARTPLNSTAQTADLVKYIYGQFEQEMVDPRLKLKPASEVTV